MLGIYSIEFKINNNYMLINLVNKTLELNNEIFNINEEFLKEYIMKFNGITFNWADEYNNRKIIDGNEWSITIHLLDDTLKTFSGKSLLPNNFDSLEELNNKLIEEVQHV